VNVNDYEVTVRRDKVTLAKSCYLATADAANAASKFFLDHGDNTSFAPGEALKVWGNVAMTTDPAAIQAVNGAMEIVGGVPCRFYRDDAVITAAEYEDELAKTFELDCPLPDGFMATTAASYALTKFIGPINDFADDAAQTKNGVGEYSVSVKGTAYNVADYSAYAGRTVIFTRDYVAIVTLGDVVGVSETSFTFTSTEAYLALETLAALKQSGGDTVPFNDFNFGITVSNVEEKMQGETGYAIKQCPVAVVDKTGASSLFVCHAGNTAFAAGEELQVAANITLTSDPAAIAEYIGTADACYCYTDTGSLTCEEYEKL